MPPADGIGMGYNYNLRRSVSSRSHRAHGSVSSDSSLQFGHEHSPSKRAGVPPLPSTSPSPPPEEIATSNGFTAVLLHQPPPPPASRLRDKFSISTRSISQRFKSVESVPVLPSPERDPLDTHSTDPVSPPLSQSSTFKSTTTDRKGSFGMHAAPAAPKRPAPDRPATSAAHATFFNKEMPSSFAMSNGVPLPHSSSSTSIPTIAGQNPASIHQNIHETSTKRIATIEYLRKVHEGNVFYFNTVHYTNGGLASLPSLAHHKRGRRATNYIVLGYSLPALLDLNSGSALEYLKALLGLLQEFDLYQNLSGFDSSGSSLGRGRVGQMFKTGMGLGGRSSRGRRSSTATDGLMFADPGKSNILGLPLSGGGSEASSPLEMPSPINPSGHDFTYLLTPYLSFEPDFGVTFATLCDALIDTYARLLDLVSGPEVCGPGVGDTFVKADKLIRKILVANVMREFDDATRAQAKTEFAGLGRLVLGGLM